MNALSSKKGAADLSAHSEGRNNKMTRLNKHKNMSRKSSVWLHLSLPTSPGLYLAPDVLLLWFPFA
jgi:hypothetical protein